MTREALKGYGILDSLSACERTNGSFDNTPDIGIVVIRCTGYSGD